MSDEEAIFGHLDVFCNRVKSLLEQIISLAQFQSLYNQANSLPRPKREDFAHGTLINGRFVKTKYKNDSSHHEESSDDVDDGDDDDDDNDDDDDDDNYDDSDDVDGVDDDTNYDEKDAALNKEDQYNIKTIVTDPKSSKTIESKSTFATEKSSLETKNNKRVKHDVKSTKSDFGDWEKNNELLG